MFRPETWTAEAWLQFLQDHWLVIAAAIVIILIVIKAVKTVLKWVLVAAIIFGIIAYGGYNIEDLTSIGTRVEETTKEAVLKAALEEASKAEYDLKQDGSYVIKTPNLELSGSVDSDEVSVKFKGFPAGTWKIEGPIRALIDQAKTTVQT